MLLIEQVRLIDKEEMLIHDDTTYSRGAGTWGTMKDFGNITLDQDSILAFALEVHYYDTGGNIRVKVGSTYCYGHPQPTGGGESTVMHFGMFYMAAGTYNVTMEGVDNGTNNIETYQFRLGAFVFRDLVGHSMAAWGSQISKTLTARTGALGSLNECAVIVHLWGNTPSADLVWLNTGESDPDGVKLKIDGTQVDFATGQRLDDEFGSALRGSADAEYFGKLSVGSAHTFDIEKTNANSVVNISIIMCPWIAIKDEKIKALLFDLPPNATIYQVLAPLIGQNTIHTEIGYICGDGHREFHEHGSGAGGLAAPTAIGLQFNEVKLNTGMLTRHYSLDGHILIGYGCIESVGVDIR